MTRRIAAFMPLTQEKKDSHFPPHAVGPAPDVEGAVVCHRQTIEGAVERGSIVQPAYKRWGSSVPPASTGCAGILARRQ